MKTWSSILAFLAICAALVTWREQPPNPLPADAPPNDFSAERAWPVLSYLADTIGHRVAGTDGADRALAYLAAKAREIPGFEIAIQDTTGFVQHRNRVDVYRTKNLIARRPGRREDAVLLSVHYDSPTSSVGAADDALSVAAVLEIMRALSTSADTLENTIIININGAEEQGLLGAHGFLKHPWARQVRVAVDLESAGPGGKALLFQTGPGEPWLAEAYASAVRQPSGTVLGQDIFQSGLVPSATDFEVYVDAGIPGLDVALYRDGYAYHTLLDRTTRINPGTLQHMGAVGLDLVRELAATDLVREKRTTPAVYYDVLGLTMVSYSARAAVILAVIVLIAALVSLIVAYRANAATIGDMLWGGGATLLGMALALVIVPVFSLLPWWIADRSHGWYGHSIRGHLAYVAAAAAIMLLFWWLVDRRPSARDRAPLRRTTGALAGIIVAMIVVLAGLTAARIGSGYLVLWMTLGGAISLIALALLGWRGGLLVAAIALLIPVILIMQAGSLLIEFGSIGGRSAMRLPYDVVLAGLSAVFAVVLLPIPLAFAAATGRRGRAAAVGALIALIALIVTAATFPFTERRPQRLALIHMDTIVSLRGLTFLDERFLWNRIADSAERAMSPDSMPAADAPIPPLTVETNSRAITDSTRAIDVRIRAPGATSILAAIPAASLRSWPFGPVPQSGRATIRFAAPPDTGAAFTIEIAGDTVPLTVTAARPGTSPDVERIKARLPAWTDVHTVLQRRMTVRL